MLKGRRILSFVTTMAFLLTLLVIPGKVSVNASVINYVNDDFDGGTSGWMAATGLSSGYEPTISYGTDGDGTTYMRMSASNAAAAAAASNVNSPYIYRDVNGTGGIPYAANKRIVIQARVRLDNRGPYTRGGSVPASLAAAAAAEPNDLLDKRVYFRYNMPHDAGSLSTIKSSDGTVSYNGNTSGSGHLSMLEWQYGFPRISTGAPWQNVYSANKTTGTNYVDRAGYWSKKWFVYEIIMDGINGKIDFYCRDDSGYQPSGLALSRTINFRTAETSLKTLGFSFLISPSSEFDVDYMKVFEIDALSQTPSISQFELAEQTFTTNEDIKLKVPTSCSEVSEGGIVLKNSQNETVAAQLTYDAGGSYFNIHPVAALQPGYYKLAVDGSKIGPHLLTTGNTEFKVPVVAPTSEINDNFEDGTLQGWSLRNSYNNYHTLTLETEANGNKFARLTLNGSVAQNDLPDYNKQALATKPVKFPVPDNEYTIIEARIRTNDEVNFRKYFKINSPYSAAKGNMTDGTNGYGVGQSLYSLWRIIERPYNYIGGVSTKGANPDFPLFSALTVSGGDTGTQNGNIENRWFTVRTIIAKSGNGLAINHFAYDSDNNFIGKAVTDQNHLWYMNGLNYLTALDFTAQRYAGVNTNGCVLDFDDVKVYTKTALSGIDYETVQGGIQANFRILPLENYGELYLIHALYENSSDGTILKDVSFEALPSAPGKSYAKTSQNAFIVSENQYIKSFIWAENLKPLESNEFGY